MPEALDPLLFCAFFLVMAGFVFCANAALPACEGGEDAPATLRYLKRVSDEQHGRIEMTYALLLCAALLCFAQMVVGMNALRYTMIICVSIVFIPVALAITAVIPGAIASGRSEAVLKTTAPLAFFWVRMLSPLTKAAHGLGRLATKALKLPDALIADKVTEEEIRQMVDIGSVSGTIEDDEREMIENVFEFNNIRASDCMVHRKDVCAVDIRKGSDLLEIITSSGLSRFPVYAGTIDNVVGILTTRDYLLNRVSAAPKPLSALMRKPFFAPESMRADDLFQQMQARKQHLAIVVDEYGGTAGIVTMEDLLEEIVGNIYDEFDPSEDQACTALPDGRWRVAGSMPLESLGEVLGRTIEPGEDCETLGGLVFSALPEIPSDGECPEVECCGLKISVTLIANRRVEWAIVEPLTQTEEEPSRTAEE